MLDIKQAPRQIKVKTKKFSLKKGKVNISFELVKDKGEITRLCLKQRNAVRSACFDFELKAIKKGDAILYSATIDVNKYPLEVSFWDVVATVVDKDEPQGYEAILGGLSAKLKLKLIIIPRWTKTDNGYMIYPFVNGARQFTIQYRKYDKRYDSYRFIAKEFLALICYFLLKPYWDSKKLWLLCEKYCTMAQDNGLYFFRYCMENAPAKRKKRVLYVIDKGCPDYNAVKEYDSNVIQFMSFKYMIYLCAAQYLISTDAIRHFYIWDSPNSIFKVLYQARKNIIFLQHGVMGFKQCHRTFHKGGGNAMARFVVSSDYEKKIIHDYFDYDDEEIIVTGLARWDVLKDTSSKDKPQILLMPTWRSWLEDVGEEQFKESEYYKRFEEFLTDTRFMEILKKYQVTLNFYIHPKFREHIKSFSVDEKYVKLITFGSQPLNELLMSCNMLITDYSSVAWDVYYQEKPIVFYPFDLETYENVQGSYMDYRSEAFGDLAWDKESLIDCIEAKILDGYVENEKFAKQRDYLIKYKDNDNSKRIYEQIIDLKLKSKLMARLRR